MVQKHLGKLCSGARWAYLPDLLLALLGDLKLFQAPSDASHVYTSASFWQHSLSLCQSRVLCSKLLSCLHSDSDFAFFPLLIEPSQGPDGKLASSAAPAVIRSSLGFFQSFLVLPAPVKWHGGVSKPVCAWLTPQCKQKMFDLLTSEQGLISE